VSRDAPSEAAVAAPETVRGVRELAFAILPIAGAVFTIFLAIGMAMPVLPLHVHQQLGFGAFIVGLVAGSQFASSLLTRLWGGHFADRHGARLAVGIGLLVAAAAACLYLLSLGFVARPPVSALILILGRGVLGAAESFVITGALGWGMALGGPSHAGKVIAWVGLAMYAAYAIGAPIGSTLYARHGFAAVALASLGLPLIGLMLIAPLQGVPPGGPRRPAFAGVLDAIRVPGLALAFSSIGFGAITIFIPLLFLLRGWGSAWLAFTLFSLGFIIVRIFLGHLPDRIGGARMALASILIEAAGLGLIWLATSPALALAGATLAGLGYSLVYPGLGVEAVKRAPPGSRALVMGAFTACLDLALGLGGPGLGLVASRYGIGAVFLASGVIVMVGAALALRLGAASNPGRNPDSAP
jgi:MFS family permease